jgi:hypothetical protein
MAINNQTLSTDGNNLFLCPADTEYAVTCIVFCNYSGATVTINVYAIPSGGAKGNSTVVIKNLELPASETFTFDTEKFVLGAGDRLYAECPTSDSAVTATVSTMRVS